MNTAYSLTISPPYRRTTLRGLRNPLKHLYIEDTITIQCILSYNKIKGYMIFPELDPKGRLHYHGIITMSPNQKVRWFKHAKPKLENIGFVDMKPLETYIDRIRWGLYIRKEWYLTQKILELTEPLMIINKPTQKKKPTHLSVVLDDGISQEFFKVKL